MKEKEFDKGKQLQYDEIKITEEFKHISDEESAVVIESLRILVDILITYHLYINPSTSN